MYGTVGVHVTTGAAPRTIYTWRGEKGVNGCEKGRKRVKGGERGEKGCERGRKGAKIKGNSRIIMISLASLDLQQQVCVIEIIFTRIVYRYIRIYKR